MEPRVSYALVGLFVLVLAGTFLVTTLWLAGAGPEGDSRIYAMYPVESVAGIAGESLVKFQGVDVGKVREVGIDPKDPSRVRLLLALRRDLRINVDTTATLASQGLTGLVYFIELRGGEPGSAPLEVEPGAEFPVIQAVPSDFVRLQRIGTELLEQANAAAGELRATLAAARGLVGERERATIGAAIGDAGRAAAELSRAGETLNARLERLGPALEDLSGAAHRLPGLTEKAGKILDEAGEAARAIGRTARQLSALSTEAAPGLATLSREGMPELVALLKDLRALAGRLDRLAGDLEQDPNLLLYGRPRRPGPGER